MTRTDSSRHNVTLKNRSMVGKKFLDDVEKEAKLTFAFNLLMAVSGTLAAIAFLTNSTPLLIGAMIVAPIYSPLALVAFSLCAGDARRALKGFFIAILGISIAILASTGVTLALNFKDVLPSDLNLINKPLLEERLRPGWYSIVVGIAAGSAGAIGTIKNKKDVMVGVVSAVALIPAGSAGAVAYMSGADPLRAIGGFTLLFINFCLIIATSVLFGTFMQPQALDRKQEASMAMEVGRNTR